MEFCEAWDDTCSSVGQAARTGNLNELQRLINTGMSVDIADNRGWRPIHEAAASERTDCLCELLKHEKTNVDWRTHEGESALLLACKRRETTNAEAAVELLLQQGADPNLYDNEEETPLLVALKNNHLPVVKLLIAKHADPNIADCSGWRPLHQAAMHGHLEALKRLLECGAQIDVQDECGMTPIFTASQHGQESCLKQLLISAKDRGRPTIVNIGAEDWATPLMIAAQQGYFSCVELLLDFNANPDLRTADNITALHLAVQGNQTGCLQLLLERMKVQPLIDACHPKVAETCQRPRPTHKDFISPLHLAVEWQSYACLKLLLSVGFSPDSIYQRTSHPVDFFLRAFQASHESALSYAVYKEDTECVNILLQAGATCNTPSPYTLHPVVRALAKPSPEMLTILLDHGSDLNHCRHNANTNEILLAALVTQYHLEMVLLRGCDPQNCFRDESVDLFATALVMNSDRNSLVRTMKLILKFVVVNSAVRRAFLVVEEKAKQFITHSDRDWQEIVKSLSEPSSLKHTCRLCIRRQLYSVHGPRFINHVHSLLLPEHYILQNYRRLHHNQELEACT